MDTKPTNTTKKPKTAKQMEAFKKATEAKKERLRKWREENLRREARGEEPLVWATKAKARKDAIKNKEKEDKLHSLFLKSLEIQKKQIEDDEEKARVEKLKIKVKTNTTRRNKPIRKDEYDDLDDYCYSESDSDSDSDSDSEDEEQPKQPQRSEPLKIVKEVEANVDDVRAEFERGQKEAQYLKYLLEQQKQQQKQQQQPPQPQSTIRPPQPAPQPANKDPQPQSNLVRPPALPPRPAPQQQQRPQYATRDDFDDLKKEIINKIQQQPQPQIKMNGDNYNLITDTKIPKKLIEPPKYTTDINYVYNQQTLRTPVEEQKPLNTVRSAINPVIEPEPPTQPQQYTRPNLSDEQLRSMMGMRQRYEIAQPPQPIQYTTNSPLLNRMFFNR